MFKNVEVVCFATCYLLAFLAELARLRFSKDSKCLVVQSFLATVAGAVAHGTYLYYNDLLQNEHFFASAGGWFSVLAFAVVLVQIYLMIVSRTRFGLFLAPLALALTGVSVAAGNVAFTPAATCLWVRAIHASSLMLATLVAIVGTICAGMYFWQRERLRKKKIVGGSFALPSLEWSSGVCRFAANTSVIALGIGVAAGFYLKIFSGAERHFDLAAAGTPILFVVALLARFPRRRDKAVDVCAMNAIHNACVTLLMLVLLYFAAFGVNGHWKTLVPSGQSSDVQSAPPQAEPDVKQQTNNAPEEKAHMNVETVAQKDLDEGDF